MNATELTTLLERATADLDARVDALVAGGAAAGRRSLRRRRGIIAAAVLAAVGVGGVAGAGLTGDDRAARGVDVAAPTPPPADARGIDTDDDGEADAWVTATLRPVEAIHRDLRRILGDDAGPLLHGSYGPIVLGSTGADPEGTDVAWWFRYDGTLTQVNVHATSMTCDGYEDVFEEPPGCTVSDGIPVAVHAPDRTDAALGEIKRPVEAWQEGYVVRIIAANSDERGPQHRERVLAEQPALPVDAMIELVTSDIWFER